MLRRLTVVLVSAAVAVPLLSGTASASCRSDLQNKNLEEGYTAPAYTPHYHGLHYVHVNGTATVLVEGDALVSDVNTSVVDWTSWTTVVAGNVVEGGTDFVDCVAG